MKKIAFALALFITQSIAAQTESPVWTTAQAKNWYDQQGWLSGCDFIPSSAINQLEMWQEDSFDSATISRELGYAASIGLNCMRVFLHHLAWQEDPAGFKNRVCTYLGIAQTNHIKTIFVFFDDCWNESYQPGKQPEPRTGIHNSGWVRDPGKRLFDEPLLRDTLEAYMKDMLTVFKDDDRILMWDLYNEPGNSDYKQQSLPLLKAAFHWARQVNPSQPITAGVYTEDLPDFNAFQLEQSDVITYHNYGDEKEQGRTIDSLRKWNKPLICSEYMARPRNSTFFNVMPLLKKEQVGAINWGLVAGKTNTKYAWETPVPDGADPKPWFHEIFRPDGTPYDEKETELIKSLTGAP